MRVVTLTTVLAVVLSVDAIKSSGTQENVCRNRDDGTFLADSNSCSSFIVCYGGKPVSQNCDPGSYFDTKKLYCMPDTKNTCSQSECKEDGAYSAHPTNCSLFYICNAGKLVEQSCGKGSYFDSKNLFCKPDVDNICWPSTPEPEPCTCAGDYTEGDLVKDPDSCHSYYLCHKGDLIHKTCGYGNYFDTSKNLCQRDTTGKCWPQSSPPCTGGLAEGDRISSSINCSVYLECTKGKLVEQNCPYQYLFDSSTKQCERDEDGKCWEMCYCEGGYKQGDLIGNDESCSSYFRCDNGKLIPDDCGVGNYFDTTTNNCVRDINGVCGCKDKPCTCPGGYEEGDFVENEDKCYSYYVCLHGELVAQSCGTGNYFDKASKRCERDYDGKCWPKCKEGDRVANETSCYSYSVCKNGELIAQTCGDDEYFDKQSKKCVRDDEHICRPQCVCEDGSKDGDLVANSANCSSYFICTEGKLIPGDCGYGNYFDKESKNCVRDEDGIHCPRPCPGGLLEGDRIPDKNSCYSYLVCKKGKIVGRTCGDTEYFDVESKKCVRDDKNICRPRVCPGGLLEDDRIPDESNCYSYLVCKKGELVAKTCGDKDYFDVVTKKCVRDDKNICRPRVCPGGLLEDDRIPDESNCYSYLVCKKGELISESCGEEDYFDKQSKKCVRDDEHICRPQCVCEDGSKDGDLVADSANCSSYFICTEGKLIPGDCGYGNYFDNESKNCVRDEDGIHCPRPCPGGLLEGERVPDINSCYSYLVCIKGKIVGKTCGDKDYFDVETKKCVRDDKNICRPRVCPGGLLEDERIPDKTNCYSYLVCKKGELIAKTCGDKDYFDVVTKKCVRDDKNICRPRVCPGGLLEDDRIPAESNCYSYLVCKKGELIAKTCGDKDYFDVVTKKCVRDDKNICRPRVCPGGLLEDDRIPDESNCYSYLVCKKGELIAESCGEEDYFDKQSKKCVRDDEHICRPQCVCEDGSKDGDLVADSANCSSYFICTEGKLIPGDCGYGNYFDNESKNCVRDEDGIHCPRPCPGGLLEGERVPDINSCYSYLVCIKGKIVGKTCGDKDYFDVETKKCVRDDKNICRPRVCPGGLLEDERIPDKTNCYSYLVCKKGELIAKTCGYKDYFDVVTKKCVRDDKNICRPRVCPGGLLEDDRIPAESNCYSYLVCKKGELIAKTCGDKDYFDVVTKKCVRDDKNICRPRVCPGGLLEDDRIPDESNCYSYLVCKKGELIAESCGEEDYFDKQSKKCVRDDEHICRPRCVCEDGSKDGDLVANSANCSSYFICTEGKLIPGDCGYGNYFDNESKNCVRDEDGIHCPRPCPGGLLEGDRVPDKNSCYSYLVCIKGKIVGKTCGDKDYFDVETKKCVRDDKNICRPRVCPGGILEGERIPDENNCYSYLVCKKGELVPKTCGDKDYFDVVTKKCVPDKENICRPHPCVCEDGSQDGDLVANSANCSSYFICYQGELIPGDCGYGNYFDAESKNCVRDEGGIHCARPCPGGLLDGDRVANETSCYSYLVCNKGELVAESCADGDYFDNQSKKCVPDVENVCRPKPCDCEDGSKDGDLVANSANCSSYLICYQGKLIPGECGYGNYFDEESKNCVRDIDGKCWRQETTSSSSTTTTTTTTTRKPTKTTKSTTTTTTQKPTKTTKSTTRSTTTTTSTSTPKPTTTTSSTTPSTTTEIKCPGGFENGDLIPSSSNCYSFLVCSNGKFMEKSCGVGKYFDIVTKTCVVDKTGVCWPLSTSSSTSTTSTKKPTTTTTKSTTTSTTTQGPCTCEGGYEDGQFVPHPSECYLFYMCYNGELVKQSCGYGNYFDALSQSCVLDTNGICWSKSTTTSTRKPTTTTTSTTTPTTTTTRSTTTTSTRKPTTTTSTTTPSTTTTTTTRKPTTTSTTTTTTRKPTTTTTSTTTPSTTTTTTTRKPTTTSTTTTTTRKPTTTTSTTTPSTTTTRSTTTTSTKKPTTTTTKSSTTTPSTTTSTTTLSPPTTPCTCLGGHEEGDFVPHPDSCYKFYICSKGELSEVSCGKGNYFNNETKSCTLDTDGICWPKPAPCECPNNLKDGQFTADPESCFKYSICHNGVLIGGNCGTGNLFNNATKVCEPDTAGVCWPKEQCDCENGLNEGERIDNPESCFMYFTCSQGNIIKGNCGTGNLFNNATKVCEPDTAGVCWPKEQCDCENGLNEGERIDNPEFCYMYFTCSQGNLVKGNCGTGNFFNNDTKTCDRDTNNCCWPCTNGEMIADIEECDKFSICNDGKFIEQQCGTGYYFDAYQKYCVRDVNGTCWKVQPPSNTCQGAKDGTLLPDPTACEKYFVCQNNMPVAQECGMGNLFNSTTLSCVHDTCGECWTKIPNVCANKKTGTFLPNSEHCDQFIVCHENHAIIQQCGSGNWFNNRTGLCEQDLYAKCINVCQNTKGTAQLPHPNCDEFYLCQDGLTKGVRKCLKGTNYDAVRGICLASALCEENLCLSSPNGVNYPVRNDPSSFYTCFNRKPVKLSCPSGTVFDSDRLICMPDTGLCIGQTNGFTIASRKNANAYYVCKDNAAIFEQCPAHTVYDENKGICVHALRKRVVNNICSTEADGTMISGNVCNKYYLCLDGESTEQNCGAYASFDPKLRSCVFNATCFNPKEICGKSGDIEKFPDARNEASFVSCKRGVATLEKCPKNTIYSQDIGSCVPIQMAITKKELSAICSQVPDKTIAPALDCRKFYICSNRIAILQQCAIDQVFNLTTGSCQADTKRQCWMRSETLRKSSFLRMIDENDNYKIVRKTY
ncbi:uncharacterized protein LOC129941219 [Eupeodes corollae]|uniref:uncharacterized protein LOC129941219 n=1 Tax=Eupeodes corollae TaxID=290404 RepID=UPI002493AB74|nr:uncharacterized protein LOC129941219 [Eupeodes corollae]